MKLQWIFVSAVLFAACWGAGEAADTVAPTLVSIDPAEGAIAVSLSPAIRLVFSEALAADPALSDYAAVLVSGLPSAAFIADLQNPPVSRPGVVDCDRELEAPERLLLRPRSPLQAGVLHTVVLTRALRDAHGNRLVGAPLSHSFTTGQSGVRLVAPDAEAPLNLAEIVIAVEEGAGPFGPADVELRSDGGEIVAIVPGTDLGEPGFLAYRVVGALAPGLYRLFVRDGAERVALPFVVSSTTDDVAAQAVSVDVRPFDGRLEVRVEADEPVFARLLLGADPGALQPRPWVGVGSSLVLREEGFADGTELFARVELRDLADGSSIEPSPERAPRAFRIHPRIRLELNEIVSDPRQDWADRLCECPDARSCGAPFDGAPGCSDRVGSSDEWIEIANRSGETVDLLAGPASWRVRVLDATPEVATIDESATMYLPPPSALSAFRDGALLVLKAPGAMNNDARIELVDPYGSVVDVVTLGKDGVPLGRSTSTEDEAIQRVAPGGTDWCRGRATPGAENTRACAP